MNDVCWETLKPPRLLHSEVLIRPLPPTQLDDDDDHHHHHDNGDDGDNDSDNDNGNDVDVDDWKKWQKYNSQNATKTSLSQSLS